MTFAADPFHEEHPHDARAVSLADAVLGLVDQEADDVAIAALIEALAAIISDADGCPHSVLMTVVGDLLERTMDALDDHEAHSP